MNLEARFQFVRGRQESSDASLPCKWPSINERTDVRRVPLYCVRWAFGGRPRQFVTITHTEACEEARRLRQARIPVTTYIRWIGDVA